MKPFRIHLVGPPFSGHLHPLLGLGLDLREEAEVSVLGTATAVQAARAAGLPADELLLGREPDIWAIAEPGIEVRNHPVRMWRQLRGNVALLGQLGRELEQRFATDRPDLVIADFTVPVAGPAARRLGIPWWTTLPSPCVLETPDGPPAYFGSQRPATGPWSSLRHAALRRLTRGFKRGMWALFGRDFRAMGFDGVYRADGTEAVYSPDRILALGIPEIEFPRTYPPALRFIGPVLYTPLGTHPPPPFKSDGRPHVLISIGTHLPQAKPALASTLHAIAARHPELVLHFSHGRVGAACGPETENFLESPYISYARHLHRYDLIVHHAGAGVLNHALRHGLPSVVFPLDYDQFDNAARLVASGVARLARRFADLEPVLLAVLGDDALRERCRAMALTHRGYDAGERVRELVRELRANRRASP